MNSFIFSIKAEGEDLTFDLLDIQELKKKALEQKNKDLYNLDGDRVEHPSFALSPAHKITNIFDSQQPLFNFSPSGGPKNFRDSHSKKKSKSSKIYPMESLYEQNFSFNTNDDFQIYEDPGHYLHKLCSKVLNNFNPSKELFPI